jgi:septal ring factor EnvC (AmiA/AmiB activator)
VEDLRNLWASAAQRGDIPGAYWAILTHPLAEIGGLGESEREATARLVSELRKRLASRTSSCEAMQGRLQRLKAELDLERRQRNNLERLASELQDELESAEHSLARQVPEFKRSVD